MLVTCKVAEDPPVQKNDLGALASGAKEMEREFASHRIKILLPNTSIQNFDERGEGKDGSSDPVSAHSALKLLRIFTVARL